MTFHTTTHTLLTCLCITHKIPTCSFTVRAFSLFKMFFVIIQLESMSRLIFFPLLSQSLMINNPQTR